MGGAWVFPGGAVDAHEGEGDAAHRAAAVRELEEEAGIARRRPRRARPVLALDHAGRGDDPLRHALLPRPRARRRASRAIDGERDRRPRLVHAAGRARRASAPARSCSSSRRSSTSSSSRAFPSADALLDARARPRGRRPSQPRVVAQRRDARASCCPGEPDEATTTAWASRSPSPARRARSASRSCARWSARRDVERILGMARRAFDPAAAGLEQDRVPPGRRARPRAPSTRSCAGADVVVHLAFIIVAGCDESHSINLEGSRNVFEAAVAREVQAARLRVARSPPTASTSDNPQPLTEDVPRARHRRRTPTPRRQGRGRGRCSARCSTDCDTDAYVFRPCIVAGPEAPLLINSIPYVQLAGRLPGAVRALFDQVPILKPVLPDPGVPFQLVHHDDVATALRAGRARPRRARASTTSPAAGEVTMRDLADALGYYTVPVPGARASTRPRRSSRGCRSFPTRRRGSRPLRDPGAHGHGEGALGARAGARATTPLDTLKATVEAHREDLSGVTSVTGTPKRRSASPTTSSSR